MRNTGLIAAMALVCWITVAESSAYAQDGNTLSIQVSGMKHNEGNVVVHLLRPGDDVTGTPFRRLVSAITADTLTFNFTNIAYQDYFAMAVHDENGNGDLDHKFIGIPKEPVGFSNNWRPSLFSGMPNFEKTGFTFSAENQSIAIGFE